MQRIVRTGRTPAAYPNIVPSGRFNVGPVLKVGAVQVVVNIDIRPGVRQCLDSCTRRVVDRIYDVPVLSTSRLAKMEMFRLYRNQAAANTCFLAKRLGIQTYLSDWPLVRLDIADDGVAKRQHRGNQRWFIRTFIRCFADVRCQVIKRQWTGCTCTRRNVQLPITTTDGAEIDIAEAILFETEQSLVQWCEVLTRQERPHVNAVYRSV